MSPGLENLWLGNGKSMMDGRGDPDDEKRRAIADADVERGLRLMKLPED